jgi:hypothetical protein
MLVKKSRNWVAVGRAGLPGYCWKPIETGGMVKRSAAMPSIAVEKHAGAR